MGTNRHEQRNSVRIELLNSYKLGSRAEGVRFKSVVPGTYKNKRNVYDNRDNIVERYVLLEYNMDTKDGCPFYPNVIRILHES